MIDNILKPKTEEDILRDIQNEDCEVEKFCNLFLFYFKKFNLKSYNKKEIQKLIAQLSNHLIKIDTNINSPVSSKTIEEFLGQEPLEITVSSQAALNMLDLSKSAELLLMEDARGIKSNHRQIIIRNSNINITGKSSHFYL